MSTDQPTEPSASTALAANIGAVLAHLTQTIAARKNADPSTSYVAKLFHKGENTILKKVAEEAGEVIIAAKEHKEHDTGQIIYESADLLFHLMAMLAQYGLTLDEVVSELARREGVSGLVEKAARSE